MAPDSLPSRRSRARVAVALGGLGVAAALAGCSVLGVNAPVPSPAQTPEGAATVETMPPATSASSTAATPSGGQQSIATLEGGNGMARPLILGAKAVPAGWQDSTPRETGGYRMTICGVDLEPNAPLDGAQARWQYSPSGPFLEQHVRVYSGGTARAVVGALAAAIPRCTQYTSTDGRTSATYRVEKLSVPGADSGFVTWRQRLTLPEPAPATTTPATSATSATALPTTPTPASTPTATTGAAQPAPVLVQDVAVTRRGSSVILLASYAVSTSPQPEVLATAVRALGPSK